MCSTVHIMDPRVLEPDTIGDAGKRAYARRLVDRGQLVIGAETEDIQGDISGILRQLLHRFPSDRLFFSYIAAPKQESPIMSCFDPEIVFAGHAGISPYSSREVVKFATCFSRHASWFEWLFGAYESDKEAAMIELTRTGLLRPDDFDPTWQYALYSMYVNLDYGQITLSCNREELFDAFIEFAGSLPA